jgi:hypothetical protein
MHRAYLFTFAVLLSAVALGLALAPEPAAAATCAGYPNQAAAQAAADTRDADGDGIYCESLPCPCSTPASTGPAPTPVVSGSPTADPTPEPAAATPTETAGPAAAADAPDCSKPAGVQNITFSATKYPHIRAHFLRALRKGWPRTLIVNRNHADDRRARLLEGFPSRPGKDRDEYPPAIGRGLGAHLTKGIDPRGWRADVAYVPSHENRSHGSTLGIKLRRFCTGTKFRYVFY